MYLCRRWRKLLKSFYNEKKGTFDISKVWKVWKVLSGEAGGPKVAPSLLMRPLHPQCSLLYCHTAVQAGCQSPCVFKLLAW